MATIILLTEDGLRVGFWTDTLTLHHRVQLVATVREVEAFKQHVKVDLIVFDSLLLPTVTEEIGALMSHGEKLLMLGENCSEQLQVLVMMQEISGYSEINVAPVLIHKTINAVLNNEIWVPRRLIPKVIHLLVQKNNNQPLTKNPMYRSLSCLTARELEVVALVYQGHSTAKMAARLTISERTVKAHLGAVFSKLKVSGRVKLILMLNEVRTTTDP
jgi:DNA-binding NarL/FixJ family response regulator